MQPITFHRPRSLEETFALLEHFGEDGRLIAGGTAIVVMLKQSLLAADQLISLDGIPGLAGIRQEPDGLHIGALTRHREVETSPAVKAATEELPAAPQWRCQRLTPELQIHSLLKC